MIEHELSISPSPPHTLYLLPDMTMLLVVVLI